MSNTDEYAIRHIARTLGLLPEAQCDALATSSRELFDTALRERGSLSAEEVAALHVLAGVLARRNLGTPDHLAAGIAPALPAGVCAPERIGDYLIMEEIGRGATGIIFHARHAHSGRDVALKVLNIAAKQDGHEVARFHREITTVRRLNHPNLVRIVDHGSQGELHYFAMEFLGGRTLRALIDERGHLSPYEAAEYMRDAARGLAYAHQHGIVHRDVKPSNLIVLDDGSVKVLDFGLAFEKAGAPLTATGLAHGTPAYMSPEQIESNGRQLDERTDVYSLGVAIYEALCGTRPFVGSSHYEIMRSILAADPPKLRDLQPAITKDVDDIVRRCIARHPAERYQSMEELIRDLDRAIDATHKS